MPANHERKSAISFSSLSAPGATKCIFSRPIAPETTCMGPVSIVRQPPTVMRCMPLRPVGNNAACQSNKRPFVRTLEKFCVASSIISTTPSTSRLAGISPAVSIPKRRAMEERTSSGLRFSPSIADDFTMSLVKVFRLASRLSSKPRPSMRPNKRP